MVDSDAHDTMIMWERDWRAFALEIPRGMVAASSLGMRSTLAILCLVGFSALGCSDALEPKECTARGCNSQVSSTLTVGGTADSLAASKVIVCRNGVCEEGFLRTLDGGSKGPTEVSCTFPNKTTIDRGPGCRSKSTDPGIIDFSYTLANDEAKDGDTYSFKIIDKTTSQPAATKEGAVTYNVFNANGDCGPTCSQATLN